MTGWRFVLVAAVAALLAGCAALGQQAIRITAPGGWQVAYEWGGRSNEVTARTEAQAERNVGME